MSGKIKYEDVEFIHSENGGGAITIKICTKNGIINSFYFEKYKAKKLLSYIQELHYETIPIIRDC